MPWFDGTFDADYKELISKYSSRITNNVLTDLDHNTLILINDLEESNKYYKLSVPDDNRSIPFYLIYEGNDAVKVKDIINEFLTKDLNDDNPGIELFRKDKDRTFMYAYGHICRSLIKDQESLKSKLAIKEDVYIVSLLFYMFKCPVCENRTLQYREMYEICHICDWEDDGFEELPRSCSGPNGCSFNTYKKRYLKSLNNKGNKK